jgi:phospho-N-acetylmuramoyl-pentapeptide-transferase
VVDGVFVMETLSSSLQIGSKRLFGKKIFLSAPVHHHFEAIGWPETKVTMRFWVLGIICAVVGLVIAFLGK